MKYAAVLFTVSAAIGLAAWQPATNSARLDIKTLSTDPSRVTGGDVLVQISAPPTVPARGTIAVKANGRDVTRSFHPGTPPNSWTGLVTGLVVGGNTIEATAGSSATNASLTLTNYPISGSPQSTQRPEPLMVGSRRAL